MTRVETRENLRRRSEAWRSGGTRLCCRPTSGLTDPEISNLCFFLHLFLTFDPEVSLPRSTWSLALGGGGAPAHLLRLDQLELHPSARPGDEV